MYNKAVIIGRLTAEPELKYTPKETAVVSFTVACDRRMSKEKQTDFITCVAWKQKAEFLSSYFHKGDPVGVEGSIQVRRYEDRQGGKRTATEIVVDNVFFVGGKSRDNAGQNPPQRGSGAQQDDFTEVDVDDDLPF